MILLTGATGLLGMHVLYDLLRKGHEVRAVYRNEDRLKKVEDLFRFYAGEEGRPLLQKVKWQKGDILDLVFLEDVFQGVTKVIHCAAMVSFRNADFRELVRVNRYGTANLVNFGLKHKVQWFCHVSSTAAIGKKPGDTNFGLNENAKWLTDVPVSGYAMSKYLAEKEVWRGIEEGLPAVIVNPCVIFGPGDWNESSLTIFRVVQRGLKFSAPGSNAFVDVRDVSKRILFLMEKEIIHERFLIIGDNVKFSEMTASIARRMKKKEPSIKVKPWQMGLAWRLAAVYSFITRKPTALTKEATRTAFSETSYDSSKMDTIFDEPYISLTDSIDMVVSYQEWLSSRI
jgi:nucleoside-diphosphate-sugar epimerase